MGPDTEIPIGFLITVISVSVAIYAAYRNNKKDVENEKEKDRQHQEEELEKEKKQQEIEMKNLLEQKENFVKVNMKLDELCRGNQAIQVALEQQRHDIKDITSKQTIHEEKILTLFKYKDEHEERLKEIEKRI